MAKKNVIPLKRPTKDDDFDTERAVSEFLEEITQNPKELFFYAVFHDLLNQRGGEANE